MHLSFPMIYERDGEAWVQPESCMAGCILLYWYDRRIETLVGTGVVTVEPLTAAAIFSEPMNGRRLTFPLDARSFGKDFWRILFGSMDGAYARQEEGTNQR